MRISTKLLLLATMAIAAIAMATAPALAQEPLVHPQPDGGLTATFEPGGVPCPNVAPSPAPPLSPTATAGGCRIHASGANIVLVAHVFGIESVDGTCNIEFDARLDGQVEGYLTHMEMTQGSQGTCTRRPCGAAEPHPPSEGRAWSAFGRETAVGQRALTFLMCLWVRGDPTPQSVHCEFSIPFSEPANHRYMLTANNSACHGIGSPRWELTGTWNFESVPATNGEGQTEQHVEINHTTPGTHP